MKKFYKTDRLTLRQLNVTFKESIILFNFIEKNKKHLTEYNWIHKIKKPEDCFKSLQHFNNEKIKKSSSQYGIYIKNRFLGITTVDNLDSNKAEICFYMDKDYCNNGYITEAVKFIEKEIFKENINKIIMRVNVLNTPSKKVCEKCGYTQEGIFKEDHIYIDGRIPEYGDFIYYGKLKNKS